MHSRSWPRRAATTAWAHWTHRYHMWICFLIAAVPTWGLAYLFSPDRKSRRERVIFATVCSAIILGGLFLLAGAMAHGRNAAAQNRCESNLQALYTLIQQSVATSGRLPIDDQRRLLIEGAAIQGAAQREESSCCGDDVASCYLVGRDIVAADIANTNGAAPGLLLYDRPGNHIRVLGNGLRERVDGQVQEQASLLLSDGSIFHWRGDSSAYHEWAEEYSQGLGAPCPPGMEERMRAGYRGTAP